MPPKFWDEYPFPEKDFKIGLIFPVKKVTKIMPDLTREFSRKISRMEPNFNARAFLLKRRHEVHDSLKGELMDCGLNVDTANEMAAEVIEAYDNQIRRINRSLVKKFGLKPWE